MPVMRFSHGTLKPGAWNDFEQLYRDLAAERGDVPGLLGGVLSRDMDNGDSGYTVSIWDRVESMQAYEASDRAKAVASRFQPFYSGDYKVTLSEMRLWDVRAAGASAEWPGSILGARAA